MFDFSTTEKSQPQYIIILQGNFFIVRLSQNSNIRSTVKIAYHDYTHIKIHKPYLPCKKEEKIKRT